MAQSPAHRFGQIVGETLEAALIPLLQDFARTHGLYLDRKGTRPCRRGKKCTWVDANGNAHDLDFVLERGGTPDKIGSPAAFIETAWRRYTKHSRNKVQEIQGAIEPLAATYSRAGTFKGAVLAGVFTDGALAQLRSLGFSVVYVSYDAVVAAFLKFGIDARSDEGTPDPDFQAKVEAFEKLTPSRRKRLAAALANANDRAMREFFAALESTVSRQIERIVILALHGQAQEVLTVADALRFVEGYADDGRTKPIERYDIEVRYNNGNRISGSFSDKAGAIEFLGGFLPVTPQAP